MISKAAPRGGHRTSCGNFLRSNWDSVSVMQARAIEDPPLDEAWQTRNCLLAD